MFWIFACAGRANTSHTLNTDGREPWGTIIMLHSMTGYGRGEAHAPGGACVVEIRSLNHRYFEIAVKTPRGFAVIENRIREVVRARFSRGRFDVYVGVDFAGSSPRRLVVDRALARQLDRIER